MSSTDDSTQQPSPWDDIPADGDGLLVSDFLTTLVVTTGNALRRAVTLQYADQFDLTMPEWRVRSVLAEARELPFGELVLRSATDKGQLSRTLRTMQERGLLDLRNEPAKKITCLVTDAGLQLYRQVMPVARRRQAEFIRQLAPAERRAVYGAMRKLRGLCGSSPEATE